jgi:hypothetical protein
MILIKRWSKAESFTIFENHVYVMAKVYLEDKVYFSPKLQTWRLVCTLSPNLEATVESSEKQLIRV